MLSFNFFFKKKKRANKKRKVSYKVSIGNVQILHIRKKGCKHHREVNFPNKKKRGVTLALCSSVVKDFFTTGMVENVGYALGAVACSLAYQAI